VLIRRIPENPRLLLVAETMINADVTEYDA
jgi:hypothetical protein